MTDRQPKPTNEEWRYDEGAATEASRQPKPTEARFPKVHKFDPVPTEPDRCMKCGFLWSSIVHRKPLSRHTDEEVNEMVREKRLPW